MTFTEFRRGLGDLLQAIFPNRRLLLMQDIRGFARSELPLVTYSVVAKAATDARPTHYTEKKDLVALTGTVTERIPHDVKLTVGLHSLELALVEDMEATLRQAWGRAPALLGAGFRMHEIPVHTAKEEWGVYSSWMTWTGWMFLDGPSVTDPLITGFRSGFDVYDKSVEESTPHISEETTQ